VAPHHDLIEILFLGVADDLGCGPTGQKFAFDGAVITCGLFGLVEQLIGAIPLVGNNPSRIAEKAIGANAAVDRCNDVAEDDRCIRKGIQRVPQCFL
jgi:hypothetical protein